MGLDIGFNLYRKEKGKFVPIELNDKNWVCGRCDATYAWDYGFDLTHNDYDVVPVFNAAYDNEQLNETTKMKYIPFKNFFEVVNDRLKAVYEERSQCYSNMQERVNRLYDEIKELRKLQKSCTADNAYAFDRWEERIREIKADIDASEDELATFHQDDYDYCRFVAVRDMLIKMREYVSGEEDNEYIVVPFFSY